MTNTTAVAERQQSQQHPIVVLRGRLEERKGEIKAALPSDISVEAFIRSVVTAASLNADILAASWQSVWLACMTACRDGLLCDGIEGAIVVYKGKASFLPMYQGLLRRFRRSGQFLWVNANIVRQGEPFRHWIDETGEHFLHEPGESFEAPIVRVYAAALTKDKAFFAAVLTLAEANKIRAMSRASRDDAPWRVWPEEMYKKTALRRLTKVLPSARDLIPPEDDAPEIAFIPPTSPAAELSRASGPAAALEQFAGTTDESSPGADHATSTQQPQSAATGGGGGTVDTDQATDASRQQRSSDAQPVSPTAADSIEAAWEHGKQAKAAGMLRKAVPGEYRGNEATALAAAWLKGHDGVPLGEGDGKKK